MIRKLVEWFSPAGWRDNIDERLGGIAVSIVGLTENTKALAAAHTDNLQRMEVFQQFMGSVETAGIRRKFGGVIDVDYDRFLNTLGPHDEAELDRTIQARKRERAKKGKARPK